MENFTIQMENVSVLSEDVFILKDITLSVPEGKSTVILGPSGCGKSTLLKTAAGIQSFDKGRIFINNIDMTRMTEKELFAFRKINGFVFQDSALWDNRSLFENLILPLQLHHPQMSPAEMETAVMDLLVKVGMEKEINLRPAQISTGEQKIVSFLRAAITEPNILFMDEPTASIDVHIANIIIAHIRDLKRKGCTIMTITHDPEMIAWLADYVVILKHGEVYDGGPYREIKQKRDQFIQAALSASLDDEETDIGKSILEIMGE